jgi:hypothetical protein
MRLPQIAHNRVSYVGVTIAGLAFAVFIFLFAFHTLAGGGRAPYAGLVIFILVPAVLLLGLTLVPIGMLMEWHRWRSTGTRSIPRFPVIDLNDPRHRNATVIFLAGSVILMFFSAFGSYRAYEYTDSVAFCGRLCHQVMSPEYTTYQNSPHARVGCVDCHVGPGADWFVRSKLSGSYQVYAVLFDKYPRPIPTPIENLRPAQETCEQCHWPDKFFGGQQKKLIQFLPDEQNTRWEVNLLIKTGGGSPEGGRTEGIHWHMNIANRVDYVAADEKRENIPWVRITNVKSGKTSTYTSTDNPLSSAQLARAEIRRMDCMDCHNRPTHIYRSPSYSLNLALVTGRIDPTLPFVKQTGVKVLAAKYTSTASALTAIGNGVRAFYQAKYPQLAVARDDAIATAIASLQEIYRNNFFPEMRVRWSDYPDNIGHLIFPGCYRCHDGKHKSAGGEVVRHDCSACHSIMAQGKQGETTFSMQPKGLSFKHPEDIDNAWQELACFECHTGEAP